MCNVLKRQYKKNPKTKMFWDFGIIISLSTVPTSEKPENTGYVVLIVAHTFHTQGVLSRHRTFHI